MGPPSKIISEAEKAQTSKNTTKNATIEMHTRVSLSTNVKVPSERPEGLSSKPYVHKFTSSISRQVSPLRVGQTEGAKIPGYFYCNASRDNMGKTTPSPADMELGSEGSASYFSYCTNEQVLAPRVTRQTCTRPENEVVRWAHHRIRGIRAFCGFCGTCTTPPDPPE